MRILILDDDDIRHKWFATKFASFDVTHVYTIHEFDEVYTQSPVFDYVFLDHDLNENQYTSVGNILIGAGDMGPKKELTGQDAVQIMIVNPSKQPGCVVVHSWNRGGGDIMEGNLRDHGFNVVRWEFNPKEDLKLK